MYCTLYCVVIECSDLCCYSSNLLLPVNLCLGKQKEKNVSNATLCVLHSNYGVSNIYMPWLSHTLKVCPLQ